MIRLVWTDPGVLVDLIDKVPLNHFPYEIHGEILRYLERQSEAGEPVDDASALSKLSEAAADELSMALVEYTGEETPGAIYDDCVTLLQKTYLRTLCEQHAKKAEEFRKEGKEKDFF